MKIKIKKIFIASPELSEKCGCKGYDQNLLVKTKKGKYFLQAQHPQGSYLKEVTEDVKQLKKEKKW